MMKNPDQHTILVSGATGRQGGAVARHLLEQGFHVRALTRNPDQEAAKDLADRGVDIVEGNFDDRDSLDQALDGVYGAFSVQNMITAGLDGEVRQGKAFADAAADAGVEHFVYSSVGGAERDTGIPHFETKWEIEKHLRSLELPATILRPVFFMNNWLRFKDAILGGQLPQPLSPDTKLQQIAVDDIGAFANLAFSDPDEWIGEAIEIAGDELTMNETARTFGRALNREVTYKQLPWDAFEDQAGEEMTIMYQWFENEGYEADIKGLREVHPDLKNLRSFIPTADFNAAK
ncbi:MAG TPA: NmrA/HSCARG family protein [Balneolaceae bacterium]|nr:NmrA/HSCARG family protein [Balneolaceae bacterium]